MHSNKLLPLLGTLIIYQVSQAQNVYRDTLPTDTFIKVYNLHFDIPVGETFLQKHHCSGYSIFKAWSSNPALAPSIQMNRVGNEGSCYFSWGAPGGSNSEATYVDNNQQGRTQRTSISNLDIHGDPSQNIMDLKADPEAPVNLQMNLGSGSSRLDLTGLHVHSIDISTGETDLIISFSEPNSCSMKEMKIKAGMSSLLLRNLEYARADKIRIENGMGETTLVIGDKYRYPTLVDLEVGAGTCKIYLGKNTPLKIVLQNSTMPVPAGFLKLGEKEFVNSAFQTKPAGAIQVNVDLGVGSLEVITDNQ